MKKGDYVWAEDKDGNHEPCVIEKIGKSGKMAFVNAGNGFKAWRKLSNLQLQDEYQNEVA